MRSKRRLEAINLFLNVVKPLLFNSIREVAAYQELLRNLFVIASSLVEIHSKADGACLFSEEGNYENIIKKTSDDINLESFYGRVALFHVCKWH